MADIQTQPITELPTKTSAQIVATDKFLGIDSAEGYQTLITDLGNYIIQQVTSNLAGTNQTLAAAISALNSKVTQFPHDPNRLKYYGADNVSIANITAEWALAKGTDSPDGSSFWYFHTFAYTKDSSGHVSNGRQIAYGYTSATRYDVYDRYCAGSTWSDWAKRPTRAEMDAVNSKVTYTDITSSADLNDYTLPGWYSSSSSTITQSLINCPNIKAGFSLLIPFAVPLVQIINIGGVGGEIYTRSKNSSGWQAWYVYTGTKV